MLGAMLSQKEECMNVSIEVLLYFGLRLSLEQLVLGAYLYVLIWRVNLNTWSIQISPFAEIRILRT